MTDVLGTLIKLLARYPVAEIENGEDHLVSAFQAADFDEVKKLPDYNKQYGLVRDAKLRIEKIERQNPNSVANQALGCLILLKNFRRTSVYRVEPYNLHREMVGRSLYQKWPAADQQTFDTRVAVFDTWTDFFISYTNRDAHTTNHRYKAMISHHYRWPGVAEAGENNYVARVIVKVLQQKPVRGFADFKSLRCGDDMEADVLKHCQSTIAFVQLIEDETLSEPPPPKKNWCLEEYNAFTGGELPVIAPNGLGNRRFFVLAGAKELAASPAMPELYKDWYNEMAKTLHIVLDKCNTWPFDKLKSEVVAIANQIVEARTQLFDAMLSTW